MRGIWNVAASFSMFRFLTLVFFRSFAAPVWMEHLYEVQMYQGLAEGETTPPQIYQDQYLKTKEDKYLYTANEQSTVPSARSILKSKGAEPMGSAMFPDLSGSPTFNL